MIIGVYGVLFSLINLLAALITLYLFYQDIQKEEHKKNIDKLKAFWDQIKLSRRRFLIIVPTLLLILFTFDTVIAIKFLRHKELSQTMQFIFLDKLHRDVDDLLDDLSYELRNFAEHHPEFNIRYETDRERIPILEDLIVDNAFKIILFAERNDFNYEPEVNKIRWMIDDVQDLREQIQDMENSLDNPYRVKRGDNHWKICKKYLLTQFHIPEDQITRMLKRTALVDELIPGFFVFNLYYKGVFLTTVTQGEAKVSPMTIRLLKRKKEISGILEENNDLRRQIEQMKEKLHNQIFEDSIKNQYLPAEPVI